MFANGNPFWTIAATLAQPLFDFGTLLHRRRAAEAAFEQAAAQYRSTVITGFQNVADALYALQADAETLKAAVAAERAAKRTLDITLNSRSSEPSAISRCSVRAGVSAGADRARAGTGQPLGRHRGAFSRPSRRLVAPAGSGASDRIGHRLMRMRLARYMALALVVCLSSGCASDVVMMNPRTGETLTCGRISGG